LSQQWQKSITVSIHKTGDKNDCSNYRQISLLSTTYILFNIIFSMLTPYTDAIIGDQCVFRCSISTTVQIFCIHQILEKK